MGDSFSLLCHFFKEWWGKDIQWFSRKKQPPIVCLPIARETATGYVK